MMRCVQCGTLRAPSLDLCPKCKADLSKAVQVHPLSEAHEPVTRPFALEAALAFSYPVAIRGVMAITAAAFVFAFCSLALAFIPPSAFYALVFLILIIFFTGLYLVTYLVDVVRESAAGKPEMPEWPTPSQSGGNWRTFLPAGLLCVVLPQIVWWSVIVAHGRVPSLAEMGWILAAGCLYLPMAALAATLLGTPLAVSPHIVLPAIFKAPLATILAATLLWCTIAGWHVAEAAVTQQAKDSLYAPFLARLAADALVCYLLLVASRLIGVTYWCYRKELGWFRSV